MNTEELKRLAEAATPGPWYLRTNRHRNTDGSSWGWLDTQQAGDQNPPAGVNVTWSSGRRSENNADFIAAANPAAVLELIDYVEYLRGKNREHFDACIGCDEELKRVTKQRDELLAALSIFMEVVDRPPKANCSCHLSPPCNDCVENFGLREAFSFADAAIAKEESKT